MCGLPVYFYFNTNYITSCGECEHIGGIVASLLAGMLTTSMKSEMAYNYGTSHTHCNRVKSDLLSMKYDNINDKWIVNNEGTNEIVSRIKGEINGSEYDPLFITKYKTLNNNVIRQRINNYTENVWCLNANKIIKNENKNKLDAAKRILNIICYTQFCKK